jgi:hypothetical protein
MSWKIDFLGDHGVVRVTTSGRMNLDDIRQMIAEGLAEGGRQGTTRFLIDHRLMTPDIPTADIYRLPELSLAAGIQHSYQVAIVYARDAASRQDFEFYEVRAHNFGYDHRLFTTPEEALAWLGTGNGQ